MKLFLLIISFALCVSEVYAKTYNIPDVQFPTIQSAINDANHNDVIIVSPGRYKENIDFLGKAIMLRSVEPNDANIVEITIIDGNEPNDPNFGSTVTFRNGEDVNSVLSGFTITGGTGSWLVIAWEYHEPYWNRCGGGVVCYNMSSPTINKNIIRDNIAGEGGGVYIYGDPVNINNPSNPPVHIEPVIRNNRFISNRAVQDHNYLPPDTEYAFEEHGDGGAIVCFQGVDAIVTGNIIEENHADYYGGGMHFRQWSHGEISNNQILGNDSALGGGIHITYFSSPLINNNLVKSNTSGGFGGGGVYIYFYSNPIVIENVITQNESTNGAGMGIYWSSQPTIRNNLIVKNINGSGILNKSNSPLLIINNTIADNSADIWGGGIELYEGTCPIIENNIIVSNGDGYGVYGYSGASAVIRYNDVWGNLSGGYNMEIGVQCGINGNISADPCFIDDANDDYHLRSNGWRWDAMRDRWDWDDVTSRCIDAGNPGYVLGDELDFVPEDPNGQYAENLRINMGFYGGTEEASLPPYKWSLVGDINNDGAVNMADVDFFHQSWLDTGSNTPTDFNRNHTVNFIDFAILAADWLNQTAWR